MTLREIDPRLGRQRGTYFLRRRPWGANFARSGSLETHPCRGSNTPMGRWPGELESMFLSLVSLDKGPTVGGVTAENGGSQNGSRRTPPVENLRLRKLSI